MDLVYCFLNPKYKAFDKMMQPLITSAKIKGVFAFIAPTIKDTNPAKANCTKPSNAEAVPECSLNLAIAKVVVFGAINPNIDKLINKEISKNQKFSSKKESISNIDLSLIHI